MPRLILIYVTILFKLFNGLVVVLIVNSIIVFSSGGYSTVRNFTGYAPLIVQRLMN